MRVSAAASSCQSRCAFTAGHSPAVMLYITVSRTVPSRRSAWWRSMPSLRAPRRSMARWLAKLKLSVRKPTEMRAQRLEGVLHQQQLAVVLTALRWRLAAYQVEPISRRSTAGTMSCRCVHADHRAAGGVEHREGEAVALGAALQRGLDVGARWRSGAGTEVYAQRSTARRRRPRASGRPRARRPSGTSRTGARSSVTGLDRLSISGCAVA